MIKSVERFRNQLNRKGMSTRFISPDEWLTTGNHAFNFLLTGTFDKGFPNRRTSLLWGPKSSGKSYLLSLAAAEAQKKGYHVIYLDTETAIEEEFLVKAGVDISPEKFTPVPIASIEQAYEAMSELFQSVKHEDKIFVAFDSLSMMLSEKEMKDFESGNMKGDQGQQAKRLKLFMKNVNSKIGEYDMFFVATGHCYVNQDLTNGKGTHIFSGGEGTEYIPSIAVFINRLKLRGDGEIEGIRIKVEINKTRFGKPFGQMTLHVPYSTGIDPYDGLLEMAVDAGIISQNRAWYSYVDDTGKEIKFQRGSFPDHVREIFDFDTEMEVTETITDDDEE